MAPSAALQARIKQFEHLDDTKSTASYPPFRTTPVSAHSTASSSSNPLEDPVSPTAASYTIIKPTVPYATRKPRIKSPSPSPPILGCKTSLIDLREWVVEDSPGLSPKFSFSQVEPSRGTVVTAPPLPPRRNLQKPQSDLQSPGYSNSLTVEHTYPPLSKIPSLSSLRQTNGHVHASSTSSFHSVSLSSDGGNDAGLSTSPSATSQLSTGIPDGSQSSNNDHDYDSLSVDDSFSFESVSSTNVASPSLSSDVTPEWEKDFEVRSYKPSPPKLPVRPARLPSLPPSPSSLASNATTPPLSSFSRPLRTSSSQSNMTRRTAPPPPSRSRQVPAPAPSRPSLTSTRSSNSDTSSLLGNRTIATARTSVSAPAQLLRPTPVPGVVRKRYEILFFANLNTQRRLPNPSLLPSPTGLQSPSSPSTPRKGWRGLSVDLITNPEHHPIMSTDEVVEGRLDGRIVRTIWSRSKLSSEKLKAIWDDCAFPGQCALDKEGFAKGMWRIDEELRRAHSQAKPLLPSRLIKVSRQITGDSLFS